MHEDIGADDVHTITRSRASCVPVRRWIGLLVAVAAIVVLALAGCADESSSGSGSGGNTADTTPPAIVSNLQASSVICGNVALGWNNPDPTTDDLMSINITWTTTGNLKRIVGTYVVSSPTEGAAATYAVTNLDAGETYRFSLIATDNANNKSQAVTVDEMTVAANNVDFDNDTFIDICNFDMLNAVRHNLAGTYYAATAGASSGPLCGANDTTPCTGYELVRSLDFATAADYASGSINNAWRPTANMDGSGAVVAPDSAVNPGWMPIGETFSAIFDGNGNSISNLYVRSISNAGLFHTLSGTVRNLGVVDGAVYGSGSIGILAARTNLGSAVIASYAIGNANGGAISDAVGGLVGTNTNGTIIASYATGNANGEANTDNVGGLVGNNTANGTIIASYATVNTDSGGAADFGGGFVGSNTMGSTVIASYATGNTNGGGGSDGVGSLAGYNDSTVTASYGFGTENSGELSGSFILSPRPSGIAAGTGRAGARMLTLTTPAGTAAGAQWNAAASNTLGAWDFGSSSQAPALRYADYDGAGTVYNCNQFPGGVCGALIPGQAALR